MPSPPLPCRPPPKPQGSAKTSPPERPPSLLRLSWALCVSMASWDDSHCSIHPTVLATVVYCESLLEGETRISSQARSRHRTSSVKGDNDRGRLSKIRHKERVCARDPCFPWSGRRDVLPAGSYKRCKNKDKAQLVTLGLDVSMVRYVLVLCFLFPH